MESVDHSFYPPLLSDVMSTLRHAKAENCCFAMGKVINKTTITFITKSKFVEITEQSCQVYRPKQPILLFK